MIGPTSSSHFLNALFGSSLTWRCLFCGSTPPPRFCAATVGTTARSVATTRTRRVLRTKSPSAGRASGLKEIRRDLSNENRTGSRFRFESRFPATFRLRHHGEFAVILLDQRLSADAIADVHFDCVIAGRQLP